MRLFFPPPFIEQGLLAKFPLVLIRLRFDSKSKRNARQAARQRYLFVQEHKTFS